jgi:importin subunit beta-1
VSLGESIIRLIYWATADNLSDLADAFPHGEFAAYYRAEWLTLMIKDTRQNREFQARTIDTARWAREQVKRQIGGSQGIQQT